MKRLYIFIFSLFLVTPSFATSILNNFLIQNNCKLKIRYYRCDLSIKSEALNSEVVTFVYFSANSLASDGVIHSEESQHGLTSMVFLHGRGYTRELNASDSMLEHL